MPARISVSTWSLHPVLGSPPFWGVGQEPAGAPEQGVPLLDLPRQVRAAGFATLELTHFHLPSLDSDYLAQLRAALEAADVELWSFLIDDGDLTGPEAERDEAWIAGLFPVAEQLGARCVRVIAGQASPQGEALGQSRAALDRLTVRASGHNLRVLTENWYDLLSTPDAVQELLVGTDIGLNLDFGNWSGPAKYDALAEIAPLAEGCHAKAHFENEEIDAEDFRRCLQLMKDVDFSGPYTLVCDNAEDRWRALAAQKAIAEMYL